MLLHLLLIVLGDHSYAVKLSSSRCPPTPRKIALRQIISRQRVLIHRLRKRQTVARRSNSRLWSAQNLSHMTNKLDDNLPKAISFFLRIMLYHKLKVAICSMAKKNTVQRRNRKTMKVVHE